MVDLYPSDSVLVTIILVSSAYKKMFAPLTDTLVISFMYKRKRSGPRIDPWDTPDFISAQLFVELFAPRSTLWYLPLRYYSSKAPNLPVIP
jgi:hypothetical protein